MCPLTSKAVGSEVQALEAAAINVRGAGETLRLGFHALLGKWRDDPAVNVELCQVARVWAAQGIPALLDGEVVKLKALTEVRYVPNIVRVLALPKEARG